MATEITTKKGKKITLLTPSEKGAKYSRELREGRRFTNVFPKINRLKKGKKIKKRR